MTRVTWIAECVDCTNGTLVMRFTDVAMRNQWIADHRAVTGHRVIDYFRRFEDTDYEQGPIE